MHTAIIVPCYNEFRRLEASKFHEFALQHPEFHIWFVNDGSKDETLSLLQQTAAVYPDRIKVYDLPKNGGKAEAIRQGVLFIGQMNQYKYLAFLDADLSAPLAEILPLSDLIIAHNLDLVAGARVKLVGRSVHRSAARHYFGRVFATYQDSLLQLGNYDTQCGLKVFEQKFALQLFEHPFTSSWFFDIELFVRARNILGRESYPLRIAEVPLNEWKEVKGSKLKLTDFAKAPFEVLKIYFKYKNRN
ncbi:MAG TPA: glycosyltransferase [Chitinophagaceae bacterium]|nr:glycosyltransferase [Chitinophagaceae bacterium]